MRSPISMGLLAALALISTACDQTSSEPAPAPEPTLAIAGPAATLAPTGLSTPTGGACSAHGVSCANASDYCHEPDGQCTGVADGPGTCTPRPEVCTEQYDPVCGCDGKTYGNACNAAMAGISVASAGACANGEA